MNRTTHPPKTQTWLQSSVQQFFKACNWDDQPIEVQEIRFASLRDDNTSLDLTLSVSQFLASINWAATIDLQTPLSLLNICRFSDSQFISIYCSFIQTSGTRFSPSWCSFSRVD